MKFYVRVFILSLSWFILIDFISFGATVYAAAAAPGVTVPFGSLSSEAQDIFRAGVERFIEDLFSYNNYDDKTYSYTSPDGTVTTYTKPDLISDTLSAISDYVEAVQDSDGITSYYVFTQSVDSLPYVILDEYCSLTHKSSEDGRHGGGGRIRIDASDYSEAISNILKKTASDSLSIGLDIVNGVPQNVTTIKQDAYISVFDYLGLEYILAPSILDFQSSYIVDSQPSTISIFTPFFITSDNKLYIFKADISTSSSSAFYFSCFDRYNILGNANISLPSYYPFRVEFRFVENSGHLYFCFCSSFYSPAYNMLYYSQYTFGTPSVSNAPILFYDYSQGIGSPGSAEFSPSLHNNSLGSTGVYFECPVDQSHPLTDSDILSADIITFGCFHSNTNNIRFDSSTLNTACQMLLSSDDPISGGEDKVITSDLTDWQKAIYVLAEQQGISFEELLSKMDLLIDSNGEITLLGLDGIQYSVSELSKKFDEIIGAVGDISGDLSELLEYLKSLNLEGLESYITAIEGTLNDLNERDKDNSAVLGDCLGTLQELKEALNGLDLEGISADVHSIANSISHAMELEDVSDIQGMDSSFIIDKFPFSLPFDLYHIVTLFVRDPVEPIFTIPIETEINAFGLNEKIDEEIVLDLTMFQINGVDIVQAVLRFSIIVGYVIMLIKLTTKLFV